MELVKLWEEVRVTHSLQEVAKVHDSPSTLSARVTKLEGSLWDAEERYMVAFNFVE